MASLSRFAWMGEGVGRGVDEYEGEKIGVFFLSDPKRRYEALREQDISNYWRVLLWLN
jgi:choline kinase